MDKKSLAIGICIGFVLGIGLSVLFFDFVITGLSHLLVFQNMNVTVAINETRLAELMNKTIER